MAPRMRAGSPRYARRPAWHCAGMSMEFARWRSASRTGCRVLNLMVHRRTLIRPRRGALGLPSRTVRRRAANFPMTIEEAIKLLHGAGGSLALPAAAARLDVSERWLRDHLDQFPNAWRLPASSVDGRNVGALRIPVRDLAAFEDRRRIFKHTTPFPA